MPSADRKLPLMFAAESAANDCELHAIEGPCSGSRLPAAVLRLAPREREVATLVYERGALTAAEVEAMLPVPISNGAVRSMLGRLVSKKVLKRRGGGAGKAFFYVPAITTRDAVQLAFRQLAEDYFEGSPERALIALRLIISSEAP